MILFVEVVGKGANTPPAQRGGIAVNVGRIFVAMFTTAVAEQPLLSVYVIVEVPIEIPVTSPLLVTVATAVFDEVQGSRGEGAPEPESWELLPLQKVKDPLMIGLGFTAMVSVVLIVHCPAVGVNV
jgi:hypothetical protein